jgi:AraC-like DNA-binding protein
MWTQLSPVEFRRAFADVIDPRSDAGPPQPFLVRADEPFEFRSRTRQVGAVSIALHNLSPFKTTVSDPAADDTVHIGFVVGGSFSVELGGSRVRSEAPVPYVLPNWEAFGIECTQRVRGVDITVGAPRLRDRGVLVHQDDFGLLVARAATPLRLFAVALLDAPSASSMTITDAAATERALDDLIVGALLADHVATNTSSDFTAGLLLQATAIIRARHRDRRLCPQRVADHLGVSLRHLQRAFTDVGIGVAREIADRRADSAAAFLAAPGGPSLEGIAARSGFGSVHELRSAFRHRFGLLPSAYRAQAAVRTPAGSR